jgi:hypothetical protein
VEERKRKYARVIRAGTLPMRKAISRIQAPARRDVVLID